MEFVVMALVVMVVSIACGLWLLVSAFSRKRPAPPDAAIPQAKVMVGDHSTIRERSASGRSTEGTVARVVGGTVLLGIGGLIGAVFYSVATMDFGGSKGRLLRLRGKAALPEVAGDSGWSDGTMPRLEHVAEAERHALAAAWLASARMEHASIAAFAQLSLHLAAFGAPAELVERTHAAALDETRHARRCYALASAYAGTALGAGPIALLRRGDGTPIELVRLAVGTLVDGCLAEGIAADVAANGARAATDPVIGETLAMIAADEARHAELAWSVLAWTLAIGDDAVHGAVAARVAKLADELAPRAPDFAGVAPDQLARHGLFDQDVLGHLATRRIAAVRARAEAMLGQRQRAAA